MKKKVTVTVCDVCEDDSRQTEPYRASLPGQRLRTFDLCDEHAEPVRRLFDPTLGKTSGTRRRQPAKRIDLDG